MLVKRHMHKASGFVAFAALAGFGLGAHAAQLDVSATVPDACTVESGSLPFGEYAAGIQAPSKIGTGTFSVNCTSAADVNILLDQGEHYGVAGNGRTMLGATSGDNLNYTLYQGTAGASATWGDDGLTEPGPSKNMSLSAGNTVIGVEGIIAANQTVGGGDYSDTVEITLVFN